MKLNEIHSDERGKISLLTEDMKLNEITLFHTNAGYCRGGCLHEINNEYTTVIEGEVIYNVDGQFYPMKGGDSFVINKGLPHYFISITDSIVIEYGATPEEKKNKHPPYRQIVDNFNKKKM